ncbi:MAG TPA: carboxypeptidase regulatory-like domain-containing protein, partial [Candidatus Polarisedimenticolia bacterium]|nr:carboxypeptidase regulatory-like domain-containing protein [Candidatus Polarisedimenticolia bacterium]
GWLAACGQDPSRTPPQVAADAVPAGTQLGSGSVAGRVRFTGVAPEPEPIAMGSDAACSRKHDGPARREDLVVSPDGGVANAFVRIASGLPDRPFAPPSTPVRLDQRGCVYRPHVVALQAGQPLLIVNSDPTLHNVHAIATDNPGFNFGMSVEGQQVTRYFHHPEVMVKLKCDVHPWMAAWIGVVDHPYHAVTGPDGGFALTGLPAGEYAVEVWHETLGTATRTVAVVEGARQEIEFSFARSHGPG